MTTPIDYAARAAEIQRTVYPGYEEPLRIAHEWIMQKGEAARAALAVLRYLRETHPYALKVGNDLVLALFEVEGLEAAQAELAKLEREFGALARKFGSLNNEETHARLGRLHRDLGDAALERYPGAEGRRAALLEYEKAWDQYNQSFAIRNGHYPGINRASLLLLRAWLTPEPERARALAEQAQEAARTLLECRGSWPFDLPDDAVWHAATEAEASLLIGRVQEAEAAYARALKSAGGKPFYKESIGKQVKRLTPALEQCLGMPREQLRALLGLF